MSFPTSSEASLRLLLLRLLLVCRISRLSSLPTQAQILFGSFKVTGSAVISFLRDFVFRGAGTRTDRFSSSWNGSGCSSSQASILGNLGDGTGTESGLVNSPLAWL